MTSMDTRKLFLILILFNGYLFCPIIHIESSPGPDSASYPRVTTILQSEQIKEIFDNATNVLLEGQELRFRHFLTMNDISALPVDCQDIQLTKGTMSGVYTIYPGNSLQGFQVFCDMETDNGGWTIVQRRVNGSVSFDRNWNYYLLGFGDVSGEYWFGNQQLHLLTSRAWYELRIDMVDDEGQAKHVRYDVFSVSDAESGFRLFVDGFHGVEGLNDDLRRSSEHNGQKFTTKDRDNDGYSENCASRYHGGWWFKSCHYAHLNGLYGGGGSYGVHWHSWTGYDRSLTRTEMKIRRYVRH